MGLCYGKEKCGKKCGKKNGGKCEICCPKSIKHLKNTDNLPKAKSSGSENVQFVIKKPELETEPIEIAQSDTKTKDGGINFSNIFNTNPIPFIINIEEETTKEKSNTPLHQSIIKPPEPIDHWNYSDLLLSCFKRANMERSKISYVADSEALFNKVYNFLKENENSFKQMEGGDLVVLINNNSTKNECFTCKLEILGSSIVNIDNRFLISKARYKEKEFTLAKFEARYDKNSQSEFELLKENILLSRLLKGENKRLKIVCLINIDQLRKEQEIESLTSVEILRNCLIQNGKSVLNYIFTDLKEGERAEKVQILEDTLRRDAQIESDNFGLNPTKLLMEDINSKKNKAESVAFFSKNELLNKSNDIEYMLNQEYFFGKHNSLEKPLYFDEFKINENLEGVLESLKGHFDTFISQKAHHYQEMQEFLLKCRYMFDTINSSEALNAFDRYLKIKKENFEKEAENLLNIITKNQINESEFTMSDINMRLYKRLMMISLCLEKNSDMAFEYTYTKLEKKFIEKCINPLFAQLNQPDLLKHPNLVLLKQYIINMHKNFPDLPFRKCYSDRIFHEIESQCEKISSYMEIADWNRASINTIIEDMDKLSQYRDHFEPIPEGRKNFLDKYKDMKEGLEKTMKVRFIENIEKILTNYENKLNEYDENIIQTLKLNHHERNNIVEYLKVLEEYQKEEIFQQIMEDYQKLKQKIGSLIKEKIYPLIIKLYSLKKKELLLIVYDEFLFFKKLNVVTNLEEDIPEVARIKQECSKDMKSIMIKAQSFFEGQVKDFHSEFKKSYLEIKDFICLIEDINAEKNSDFLHNLEQKLRVSLKINVQTLWEITNLKENSLHFWVYNWSFSVLYQGIYLFKMMDGLREDGENIVQAITKQLEEHLNIFSEMEFDYKVESSNLELWRNVRKVEDARLFFQQRLIENTNIFAKIEKSDNEPHSCLQPLTDKLEKMEVLEKNKMQRLMQNERFLCDSIASKLNTLKTNLDSDTNNEESKDIAKQLNELILIASKSVSSEVEKSCKIAQDFFLSEKAYSAKLIEKIKNNPSEYISRANNLDMNLQKLVIYSSFDITLEILRFELFKKSLISAYKPEYLKKKKIFLSLMSRENFEEINKEARNMMNVELKEGKEGSNFNAKVAEESGVIKTVEQYLSKNKEEIRFAALLDDLKSGLFLVKKIEAENMNKYLEEDNFKDFVLAYQSVNPNGILTGKFQDTVKNKIEMVGKDFESSKDFVQLVLKIEKLNLLKKHLNKDMKNELSNLEKKCKEKLHSEIEKYLKEAEKKLDEAEVKSREEGIENGKAEKNVSKNRGSQTQQGKSTRGNDQNLPNESIIKEVGCFQAIDELAKAYKTFEPLCRLKSEMTKDLQGVFEKRKQAIFEKLTIDVYLNQQQIRNFNAENERKRADDYYAFRTEILNEFTKNDLYVAIQKKLVDDKVMKDFYMVETILEDKLKENDFVDSFKIILGHSINLKILESLIQVAKSDMTEDFNKFNARLNDSCEKLTKILNIFLQKKTEEGENIGIIVFIRACNETKIPKDNLVFKNLSQKIENFLKNNLEKFFQNFANENTEITNLLKIYNKIFEFNSLKNREEINETVKKIEDMINEKLHLKIRDNSMNNGKMAFKFLKYVLIPLIEFRRDCRYRKIVVNEFLFLDSTEMRENFEILLQSIYTQVSNVKVSILESMDQFNEESLKKAWESTNDWEEVIKLLERKKNVIDHLKGSEGWVELNFSYKKESFDAMKKILQEMREYSEEIYKLNDLSKLSNSDIQDVNKYYADLNKYIKNTRLLSPYIKKMKELKFYENEKMGELEKMKDDVISKKLEENVRKYIKQSSDKIVDLISNLHIDIKDEEFDLIFLGKKHLKAFLENVDEIKIPELDNTVKMIEEIPTKLKEIEEKIEIEVGKLRDYLVFLKRAEESLYFLKSVIFDIIEKFLERIFKKNQKISLELGKALTLEETGIGELILEQHPIFDNKKNELLKMAMIYNDFDQLLKDTLKNKENTDMNEATVRILKECYEVYKKKYKDLLDEYIGKLVGTNCNEAKIIMKPLIDSIKKGYPLKNNETEVLPIVLAHIACLWSLLKSELFFENDKITEGACFEGMPQPHSGQILAIFRMFGLGFTGQVQSHLVELKTGEGKSLVLAFASILFALKGYKVYCACFSHYLSKRDKKAFLQIFIDLDVKKQIKYGTFDKLCEKVINQEANLREYLENSILEKPLDEFKKKNDNIILIIDEADLFFDSKLIENGYIVGTKIRHSKIEDMIEYIWRNRNESLTLKSLSETKVYKDLIDHFKKWKIIIQTAIKYMLRDVKSFQYTHELRDGKIGIFENGLFHTDFVLRYKTAFLHIYYHESGKISEEQKKRALHLNIKGGTFSYLKIANEFKYIFGATGTLMNLSKNQKTLIEDVKYLGIAKKTFIPSIFGEQKRKFDKFVIYSTLKDWHSCIEDDIKEAVKSGRSVVVFFENMESLKSFHENSAKNLEPEFKINVLHEKMDVNDRTKLINRAGYRRHIIYTVREMGRGVDYICRDKIVLQKGGILVIQTFFSEDSSEEEQIKGRCARQGKPGSHSIITFLKHLEKYGVISTQENYNQVSTKRNGFFEKSIASLLEKADELAYKHEGSVKFKEKLKNSKKENPEELCKIINEFNKLEVKPTETKTLILVDGTSTMENILKGLINNMIIIFKNTTGYLRSRNIKQSLLKIQIAIYRDYDVGLKKILEYSGWKDSPDQLIEFLNSMESTGGGDFPEAVEIGLWYAKFLIENGGLSQVLLIADAPAKGIEAIEKDRKEYGGGEEAWAAVFGKAATWKTYAEILKTNNVPIYTIYLLDEEYAKKTYEGDQNTLKTAIDLKNNFIEISEFTKGESTFIPENVFEDPNSVTFNEYMSPFLLRSIDPELYWDYLEKMQKDDPLDPVRLGK